MLPEGRGAVAVDALVLLNAELENGMTDLVEPQNVDIVYETDEPVLYEVIDSVAWITMNRPQFNNAQNGQMTYALDDAFQRAVHDDAVRCIVLAGEGKHFSAGHDIGTPGRDLHKEFEQAGC